MKTVEVKTEELSGSALDWAVAKSVPQKYWPVIIRGLVYLDNECEHIPYSPSNDWSQCGPLIDRRITTLCSPRDGYWCAHAGNHLGEGDSALVASCRAIVANKLGDTVSVPAELLETKNDRT